MDGPSEEMAGTKAKVNNMGKPSRAKPPPDSINPVRNLGRKEASTEAMVAHLLL